MNAPRHIHQTEGNRRQTEENRRQADDNKRQAEDNLRAPHPIEVRLTDETIKYLDERIADAVRVGIQSAMTEDTARKFWATGLSVLQDQATERAGKIVIGGMFGLLRKLMVFFFLGSVVYAVGGWSALAKSWDLLVDGLTSKP